MRALIIEDEEILASTLAGKIARLSQDIIVDAMLPSLQASRVWLGSHEQPDMMFMDIQLGDGVSFELFDEFTLTCPIIFTTAYDEYALRAFKVNGVDYLLKPVGDEELLSAIEKCRLLLKKGSAPPFDMQAMLQALAGRDNSTRYKEKFLIHQRNQWLPVRTADVACISKEVLNYITLFNGERFMIDYSTLDEVEELLDPAKFFRVTRQAIVNIDAIQSIRNMDNAKLRIILKEPNQKIEIEMSRLKGADFKRWLDK